jgi:hypothetical protein
VRTIFQDTGDQFLSVRADLPCPADEPRRSPFKIFLMRFGHVLGDGGGFPGAIAPEMGGDSSAFEEDLDGGPGEPHLHLLMNELIGNAVVMAIHLDMVIDIDLGAFPFSKDEPMRGERLQGGFFQSFEQGLARGWEFLKGAIV